MYESLCKNMQQYFGEDKSKLHYVNTDSFVVSVKQNKGFLEDLEKIKEDFDFNDLDLSH